MGEVNLEVRLLEHTSDPEKVVALAAKLCYSASKISDIKKNITEKKAKEFIEKLMEMKHESPIEHISYIFGVEGISRACSHQLVRHRIASFSQQSQRYVNEHSSKNKDGIFDYIIPPKIKEVGLENWFKERMNQYQTDYDFLVKILGDKGEISNEDARFLLPNAAETKIIVTMNARSLFNFFKLRTCNRAQWEINSLAKEMYKLVLPTAPSLFLYAGPNCVTSKCEEGKMSCGLSKEVNEEFEKIRGVYKCQ